MKFLALLALLLAFVLVVAAFEQDQSSDLVEATNDLTAVDGIIDDEHSIDKRAARRGRRGHRRGRRGRRGHRRGRRGRRGHRRARKGRRAHRRHRG